MDTTDGTAEDSEEKSSEKEEPWTIIREAMEKLLEFDEKVDKGRKDISNTILEGISGLGATYDERLTGLEEDIKELKCKEGKEKGVDFIFSEEEYLFSTDIDAELEDDLNNGIVSGKLKNEFKTKKGITLSENVTIIKEKEDRWTLTNEEKIYCIKKQDGKFLVYDKSKGVAETLSSVQKEHLEKIVKTILGESGIEDLKDRIGELYGMGSINLEDDEFNKELKRVRLIMGIVSLLPEKDKGIPELDEVNIQLIDVLARSKKFMSDMYTRLLHNEGVMLLKTGAFKNAYECFNRITIINPSRKGAWLNRGVAAGKLGDIDNEIESYKKALNEDPQYDKALKNMKIAKIKKLVIMKMQCITKLLRKEKS